MHLMLELQQVSSTIGMDELRANLHSGDRQACAGAQQVLVHLGSREAIDVLAESLQTADSVGVANVARLLARLQARTAVPALIRCLDTRATELDGTAKRWVSRALGRMPHRTAVPVLAKMLQEPRYRTRATAAWAIARIRAPESQATLEKAANGLSWWRGRAIRRALEFVREDSGSC